MTFEQFITYAVWIAILVFAFWLLKLLFALIDRIDAISDADRARAALEDAQAQQIRSKLQHFEAHGGRLFFWDGGDHNGLPYIEVGPVTEADAPAEPEPVQNPDLVTAKKLVDLSLAKFTGSGNQIVTYENSGIDHNAHADAVKWMARQGVVMSTNSGIFTRDMTLAGLKLWLTMAEAANPPAGRVWTAG